MDNTIDKVRRYKEMLADIADINIRVQELEEEILGTSGQNMGERTGKTYKITSSVEQQAELLMERKEQLYREQAAKKRELERINNAMTILTEEEKDIIQIIHIERRKYYVVQDKLNLSYQRIKQLEKQAAKKMERYVS
jgi:DNA-directed RNA polymerase specialized sigma subunit